jgi:alanyl-tRNA synthetase
MKHLLIAIMILTSFAAGAQTGVDAMAKQRAKNVAKQNNNRSVELPAAAPAPAAQPAAPPAPPAAPLNSSQQAYARFQSQLLAVKTNSTETVTTNLANDLTAVAQGASKPAPEAVSKLADHLTSALEEAKIPQSKKVHLAQEVAVVMNCANALPANTQAMIKDVQSILEAGGSSSDNSQAVAADLQAIADGLQKPAAK